MPRAFRDGERAAIHRALSQAACSAMEAGRMRKTSIQELADAAGISKGAFYGFYESKQSLVIAVLLQAEALLRDELLKALEQPAPLKQVLTQLFSCVWEHPMLALLRHPEDFAWLTRSVDPAVLAEAEADDLRFFSAVHVTLLDKGALDPAVTPLEFAALPKTAMALAQGSALMGEQGETQRSWVVQGLVLRLSPEEEP